MRGAARGGRGGKASGARWASPGASGRECGVPGRVPGRGEAERGGPEREPRPDAGGSGSGPRSAEDRRQVALLHLPAGERVGAEPAPAGPRPAALLHGGLPWDLRLAAGERLAP